MKQNFWLHYFYGENENAIYTQAWCILIDQLLLTLTQKIAQAKKAFPVAALLVRTDETHMIEFKRKHVMNIIFNHVRFHPTFKIKLITDVNWWNLENSEK